MATAETHALIACLSLADIEHVQASRKGKARDGSPPTDEELAFRLYAEELSGLLACSRDAVLACSIDRAVEADRALLRAYADCEAQDARDRDVALRLAGQTRPAPSSLFTDADDVVSLDDVVDGLSMFSLHADSDVRPTSATMHASSSRTKPPTSMAPATPFAILEASHHSDEARKAEACVICTDPIRGAQVRAPCEHYYDVSCLRDLFRSATLDESLYPPRCCQQPFVLQDVRRFLGEAVATAFETKAREFGTANRVYCHRPACSAFLGAVTRTPHTYACPSCRFRTCGQCKQAAHPLSSCDTAQDEEVLRLGAQEGWKQCPGCNHLVELAVGCYHMTCRCRKQFCYLCAADWKTCGCPQWEERRLLDAAAVRVERQQVVQPPRATFHAMVRQMAEQLRTNHECEHQYWRYRAGRGRCESCNYVLPTFLLQCRSCQMLACVRCRRNRL